MKVWPLKEHKTEKLGTIVTFEYNYYDEKKEDIVREINVVSKELVLQMLKKCVKKGRGTVILLDQETGKQVGFDRDEDGQRFMYPGIWTDEQDRIPIDKFPWEE